MTTISLREQTDCRSITPKSSTCIPICAYRQKVTKGFHLVGTTSANTGLSPLKGVSILSREDSGHDVGVGKCVQTGSAPPRWENQGDIKVKSDRDIKSCRNETRGKEYDPEEDRKRNCLSVVGERLNSLSNLSCVLGTTPLIRSRKHTPECDRPVYFPITTSVITATKPPSKSSSVECESPISMPNVPPCSPAPYSSSPVKQLGLDGMKICGLAVSKSAQTRDLVPAVSSGHRDFVSGHVRKVTYCCDKCELRMMEHEAMLLERSHSHLYQRYSPRSYSSQCKGPDHGEVNDVISNDIYELRRLSQILRFSRDQREFLKIQKWDLENGRRDEKPDVRSDQKSNVVCHRDEKKKKSDTSTNEDGKDTKLFSEKAMEEEVPITTEEDGSNKAREGSETERFIEKCNAAEKHLMEIEKCVTDAVNSKQLAEKDNKVEIKKSTEDKNIEKIQKGEEKITQDIFREKDTYRKDTEKSKQKIQGDGSADKSECVSAASSEKCKFQDKNEISLDNLSRKASNEIDKGVPLSNRKEDSWDEFLKDTEILLSDRIGEDEGYTHSREAQKASEANPLQDLFSSLKEKLLALPKILSDLKLSPDPVSLQSSTSNAEESTELDEFESGSTSKGQSSRSVCWSTRLMEISSRERLSQILRDCEDVINDTPSSFLPDITMPARDVCYTAMVDKRYNRWKNRKRRKMKKSREPSTCPSESSSEESKLCTDGATSVEAESEDRAYMKFRRRRRLPEDEELLQNYKEIYPTYDASSEMTPSSSDKDTRYLVSNMGLTSSNSEQRSLSDDTSETRIPNAPFNDKDLWKTSEERKSPQKLQNDSTPSYVDGQVAPPYVNGQPPSYVNGQVAPPLISENINGPYLHVKEMQTTPAEDSSYLKTLSYGKMEKLWKLPDVNHGDNSSSRMKFTSKNDTTPTTLGPITQKRGGNLTRMMGTRKQELFQQKYRQTTANEPTRSSLDRASPGSDPLFTVDYTKKLIAKTLEKKNGSEKKQIYNDGASVPTIQTMKNNQKNDEKRKENIKPKKSGMDRRKCINMMNLKKVSTPKPLKPLAQRSQSQQIVKKEMPRSLSSLSFSPAFTFSFFELPPDYKTNNKEISRRASTAFSKSNFFKKFNQ